MDHFYWKEKNGLKLLVANNLEAAGFVNGFSTRLGGVSPFPENDLNLAGYSEDTEENIEENRHRFLKFFGNGYRLSTVWQIHGDTVKTVRSSEDASQTEDRADALVSEMKGLLVGVKTADCVPVLIADPESGAFSAVHAGWRGTLQRIVEKAVQGLATEFGSNPGDLVAAIGPAAGGECYEVGPEVVEQFASEFSRSEEYFSETNGGHALVDLHLANQDQLVGMGLDRDKISTAPFCTMERTDLFFSYRKEKGKLGKTGRLLSVIGRA
ncbi:MAG: peptidoglycan editing factor PgeF [Acidobacteria bacterium]|nr:MAG: peptidoglycan editing factor PgeF [Acidobacteriota bacterium]REJ98700.1 MAG: peptidoglycan editing factor PgeF [Acidobacteriota bacterium]REK16645.1 MAG: peptidoglycan editing factor PgeF [Acidobacteriota bacterium]REK42556.1 MAG: peptidoglycan editing factor PgeF [Acidobacteriota bacterium]